MKKFLPYILILIVLVGILSPSLIHAQTQSSYQQCLDRESLRANPVPESCDGLTGDPKLRNVPIGGTVDNGICKDQNGSPRNTTEADCPIPPNASWTKTGTLTAPTPESALSQALDQCASIINGSFSGCFQRFVYFVFISIPSFLLILAAKMFNFMAALTLSSAVYKYPFIESIWRVIRDFANIAFILVLLYAAIQMILGLGHGGAKKTIAAVITIALIVNFSLFFTKVVIDSSNILALIFYNKIQVDGSANAPISNAGATNVQEKDLSGALVSRFNVNNFFRPELIRDLKLNRETGLSTVGKVGLLAAITVGAFFTAGATIGVGAALVGVGGAGLAANGIHSTLDSNGITLVIGMMVAYGMVIYSLAYAFFVVALSFLGRMMTLMMLMIVSPFAFVSYTIPNLKRINRIGFDSWLHKLVETSFVATIFMFILYIISEILRANIFVGLADKSSQNVISILILIFVPAILITMLLLAGAKYAQHASGEFSEKIVGFGKSAAGIVGGLVIGGGIGIAAKGLQATAGVAGKAIHESQGLKDWGDKGGWMRKNLVKRTRIIAGGEDGTGGMAGANFDARAGVIGAGLKFVGGASGINLGHDSKLFKESGGHVADIKRKRAKDLAYAEGLKLAKSSDEQKKLRGLEAKNQEMALKNEAETHRLEKEIDDAKNSLSTLKGISDTWKGDRRQNDDGTFKDPEYQKALGKTQDAAQKVADLEAEKGRIRKGYTIDKEGKFNTHNGNMSEAQYLEIIETEKTRADAETRITSATKAHADAEAEVVRLEKEEAEKLREAVNKPTSDILKEEAKNASDALKLARTKVTAQKTILNNSEAVLQIPPKFKYTPAMLAKAKEDYLKGELGKGQNVYETTVIPGQLHHIKHIDDKNKRAYADMVQHRLAFPWNQEVNEQIAHEIRMGAKPEKGHGGKGGGHGGVLHGIGAHFAGAALAGLAGGHAAVADNHGASAPAATPAPAGDHGGGHA